MTLRVLLIDDEKPLREVVQTCLEIVGDWEVVSVGTAREGLLKAETEQLDGILLDVMMPEMDGIAFLQNLRNNPATQGIPVILLTAKMHPDDLTQYAQLGVAGVIAKPFDPLKLAEQVATFLNLSP
jgi:CheY-like chemotaxis protein